MHVTPREPSTTRKLLALYVDYLFFSALCAPAAWWLFRSGHGELHWFVELGTFLMTRLLVYGHFDVTPGTWAVGYSERTGFGYVQPTIVAAETWWTMTGGALLMLEGSKNIVRWTQGLPPPPFFGAGAPEHVVITAIVAFGVLNMTAGLLILRANYRGAIVAIGVLCVQLIATLWNARAFRAWAAQAVTARRQLQNVPVRPGEVEQMQAVTTYLPAVLGLGVVLAASIGWRLWTRRPGVQAPGNDAPNRSFMGS